jgi:hypothetical protein
VPDAGAEPVYEPAMSSRFLAIAVLLAGCARTDARAPNPRADGDAWWAHVEVLASDALEGRNTGSPGFAKAAAYVSAKLKDAGVEPGGTRGFERPSALEARTIKESESRVALVRGDKEEEVALGPDLVLSTRPRDEGALQ